MKAGGGHPSLKRATDLALLVCSALFLICILTVFPFVQADAQAPLLSPGYLHLAFLLLVIALSLNILVQFFGALNEGTTLVEPSPDKGATEAGNEFQIRRRGTLEHQIPSCHNFLDETFSRFSSFQQFDAPHLFFCYFAKRGVLSLFSFAWIKTGFLFLLVLTYPGMVDSDNLQAAVDSGIALLLLTTLCFWLPGVLIRFSHPYQKLWLCLAQEGGALSIRVIGHSPLRKARLDRLLRSARQVLDQAEDDFVAVSSSIH